MINSEQLRVDFQVDSDLPAWSLWCWLGAAGLTLCDWLPALLLILLAIQEVDGLLDQALQDHLTQVDAYLGLLKLVVEPLVLVLDYLLVEQVGQLDLAHVLRCLVDHLALQSRYLLLL